MTGLEKIIDKINADSKKACESVIGAANETVKKLKSEAEIRRADMAADIHDDAVERAAEIEKRGDSAARRINRQTLLKLKIEIINDVLRAALSEIKSLDDTEYFEVLSRLAVSHAQKGSGEMLLSAKDKNRLPEGFISSVISRLPEGYEIKLSDKQAEIDGGFILVYGDIDVNCSFDALAEEKRDEILERICAAVFI